MIPFLYLKGISTGDFSEALTALLGEKAAGLSATNIVRLKKIWEQDYKEWNSELPQFSWTVETGLCGTLLEDQRAHVSQ